MRRVLFAATAVLSLLSLTGCHRWWDHRHYADGGYYHHS
jgi:hypothetical protein